MYELDEIDWRILRILEKRRCLKISDVARDLRDLRSESAIRARIYRLHFTGFIRLNRSIAHGKVYCELSDRALRVLESPGRVAGCRERNWPAEV